MSHGRRVGDDPPSRGFKEFKADGEAGVGNKLAVSDAGKRTERPGNGGDGEPVVGLPAANAEDAGAAQADVFGESGFGARERGMPGDIDADFHGNARLAARRDGVLWDPHPKWHFG